MGGKGKLLWLINKLSPNGYVRFVDVFGGSATVTLNRPLKKGCMEVYNDYNSNLTNLFRCVKERPMALIRELGFLPLNSRDDFNVLEKFFNREEFTEDYLKEELELTQVYLNPPQAEAIKLLMAERSRLGDVRRAADYFKLVRYSFSGGGKAFAGRSCDIRQFFYLIWENSRRLARVIIENKDCVGVIVQYDRSGALIYCDPPHYEAEGCYAVVFTRADHIRLHDALLKCQGFVMVPAGLGSGKAGRAARSRPGADSRTHPGQHGNEVKYHASILRYGRYAAGQAENRPLFPAAGRGAGV